MNENYDQQELAKFASLAAHWWDPTGDLKTLHEINPIRLGYISEKIDLNGKTVIDIGCGGGILSESMAAKGAQVTGVDMNKSLIEVAKLHQLESGMRVEYLHTQAETIATERPAYYDAVTCLEMLEHVPDPASIVRACAALVKPGGHLFFSTLNRNPKAYLFAILGAEYILKLLPKNTHDYAKFIRPSELSAWTREAGLMPQEVKGISYQPFSQQFKLTDDISVNYLFYARKSL
ncbi:bifunctional 2-polyprenyl-6-hydroxyphenol methylase/3-demethylubiquinol 3-O-methyltransferase UbiG [Aquicella lusitana]|uniref:Ubiquinone biosynthesis O-methyltransferase n=1 Tax=Aquicella lusitana TaxID=254246 RepID=A0A370GYT5_9COXI|nr:bifunctional 2-polyprenyl-6-hydroxyphenol methylase/3-demethylubiquinol 3-O-methyltransferase UbiG [Aquicella lusitana]RDI48802.1 3-demethylubiquinone-9 3-methyltransferase [Aquicella lusitana]VVC73230.1 Ubiquinone biosynthesis O-methyltransferase [Aquicella lusitana]